jgi:hypothetical protein
MTVADDLAAGSGPLFLAAEIVVFQPGSATVPTGDAWGAFAWGTLTNAEDPLESTDTLRVSDTGYVTLEADTPSAAAYQPILAGAFEIDRAVALPPDAAGAGAAWGALRLINHRGALDAVFAGRNIDGRAITVRMGRKERLAHGYAADPSYDDLVQVFGGFGTGMVLEDGILRVELRDAGYWLERPAGGDTYGGAGGLDGNATLKGKRKPRTRGGTSGDPVRNVPAVLVDPAALIYQYTDAAGTVVTLYERGLSGGITFSANTTDLYTGSTPAGQYRTDNSKGLFQLGSSPVGQITVDCTGAFPDASTPTTAAAIAEEVLIQDAAIPSGSVDSAAFAAVDTARAWTAGFHLRLDEPLDGIDVAGRLLASIGARLVPLRTGEISAMLLAAPEPGTAAAYAYTEAQIVACTQRRLGPPLDPPPYRVRVGHQRNHTIQTSDVGSTVTDARRALIAEPWQVAAASSAAVLAAWRIPSDPALLDSDLLDAAEAEDLAEALRDLWCSATPRRVWDVTLPLPLALRHDIGDVLHLTYGVPGLATGALVLVVGEQIRAGDGVAIIQVLA